MDNTLLKLTSLADVSYNLQPGDKLALNYIFMLLNINHVSLWLNLNKPSSYDAESFFL